MGDVWVTGGPVSRRQFVVDVVGAAIFGLVLAVLLAGVGQWSGVAVVCLLALALALRHRLVGLMIVLAVAAAAVQVITTTVAYPADTAYAVLFFSLGSHTRRRSRALGLFCAVIATVVAGVFMGVQMPETGSFEASIVSGFVFAAITSLFAVGGWGAGYIRC